MDLYTLDAGFLRDDLIEGYDSLIWTERYDQPGEVQLVVPETTDNRSIFVTDRLLSIAGSKEVMLVDSVEITDKKMTIKGSSLLAFLNERIYRGVGIAPESSARPVGGSTGGIIRNVVEHAVYKPGLVDDPLISEFGTFDPREVIPGLTYGFIDASSTAGTAILDGGGGIRQTSEPFNFGPILPEIMKLAQTASLGLSIYLDSATDSGYVLKFTVYKGADRTSTQVDNPLVRFSPKTDTLANINELYSSKGFKTVAYAYATMNEEPDRGDLTTYNSYGIAYAPGFDPLTTGFARRTLIVLVSDISQDELAVITQAQLKNLLDRRAADALANNNYTQVVDGEVVPQSRYVYGEDYFLGDIVELEGLNGVRSKARITEYIRSQEKGSGEKAYPTVSVIES